LVVYRKPKILMTAMPFVVILVLECVWPDVFFAWKRYEVVMWMCVGGAICAMGCAWLWWKKSVGFIGALMVPFSGGWDDNSPL
jgi:tryptophan-rich sensory protein